MADQQNQSSQVSVTGTLPTSLQGAMYAAMATMSQYDIDMMQQYYEQMQRFAEAYGGLSPNGDQTDGGMVGLFLNEAQDAAQSSGKSMRLQAFGKLGGAVLGTAAAVGMGAMAFGGGTGSLEDQLKKNNEFKTALQNAPGLDFEAATEAAESLGPDADGQALADAVEGRINNWIAGAGDTGFEDSIGKYALSQATSEEKTKIFSRIDQDNKMLESQLNAKVSSNDKVSNFISLANKTGGDAIEGGFGIAASVDQTQSQVAQAVADVEKQEGQQVYSSQTNAEQEATQFLQEALQTTQIGRQTTA